MSLLCSCVDLQHTLAQLVVPVLVLVPVSGPVLVSRSGSGTLLAVGDHYREEEVSLDVSRHPILSTYARAGTYVVSRSSVHGWNGRMAG